MEKLNYKFDTQEEVKELVHVGVVASGDLEVLVYPTTDPQTTVEIVTGSDGFGEVWKNVLDRFFARYPLHADFKINDFGATPGVVNLRLAQAMEEIKHGE